MPPKKEVLLQHSTALYLTECIAVKRHERLISGRDVQRQRSGSAAREVAARTLDPEPITFSPPGYRRKGRQELFSARCQGEDRVNHRHQAATPSVAH